MRKHILGQFVAARTLDGLACYVIFLLACPIIVLTALAIRLEDGWDTPVVYTQRRIGLDGRTYNAIKFCTTRTDVKSARYGRPRLTRVGAVIRKWHIDDLPQIINVAHGEVSLFLNNDRTLRGTPDAWRAVAISVALTLLGVLLVRVNAVVETAGIFRETSQWNHPTSAEDHGIECKRRQTSSSYRPRTGIIADTTALMYFRPGVTTEVDVEKELGAPLSKGYDPVAGQACFTYAHTNATFRFAHNGTLIEFYGPTQTPTPSPAAKQ